MSETTEVTNNPTEIPIFDDTGKFAGIITGQDGGCLVLGTSEQNQISLGCADTGPYITNGASLKFGG